MTSMPRNTLDQAVYVVVFYDYVENMLERRIPHRAEHLARAHQAKERGELINAGAVGDADGALFVFAPDAEAAARAFVEGDPYVSAGLVPSWRVTTWNVVS
jgi:uncharacterized protein YciI